VLKISRDSGYDSRTVKAQIQKERNEQDMREARTAALRMALQDHYKDFCTLARRLSDKVAGDSGDLTELEAEDLWPGLREHLVRAPLWRRPGTVAEAVWRTKTSCGATRGKMPS